MRVTLAVVLLLSTAACRGNPDDAVYVPVTKRSDASTLAVVHEVKTHLQTFQNVLPNDVKVDYVFDQSPYVTRAR